MANEEHVEYFKVLLDAVKALESEVKGETKAAVDIAAEVEREARAAIDKAETVDAKLERAVEMLRDTTRIAFLGLVYWFITVAADYPKGAREMKDEVVATLRLSVSNRQLVDVIEEYLTGICDRAEKRSLR